MAGVIVKSLAQVQKIIILRAQLVLGRFAQLIEDYSKQVVNGKLPVVILKSMLIGQQLKQLMAIAGVWKREGNTNRQSGFCNIGFVRIETDPVVNVLIGTSTVIYSVLRRIKNNRVGRKFF
ncbi:hypothetical protein D3C75_990240 [compost metagenome]